MEASNHTATRSNSRTGAKPNSPNKSARMSASGYKAANKGKASSEAVDSETDSIDSDEEEAFPPEGPFQA